MKKCPVQINPKIENAATIAIAIQIAFAIQFAILIAIAISKNSNNEKRKKQKNNDICGSCVQTCRVCAFKRVVCVRPNVLCVSRSNVLCERLKRCGQDEHTRNEKSEK